MEQDRLSLDTVVYEIPLPRARKETIAMGKIAKMTRDTAARDQIWRNMNIIKPEEVDRARARIARMERDFPTGDTGGGSRNFETLVRDALERLQRAKHVPSSPTSDRAIQRSVEILSGLLDQTKGGGPERVAMNSLDDKICRDLGISRDEFLKAREARKLRDGNGFDDDDDDENGD